MRARCFAVHRCLRQIDHRGAHSVTLASQCGHRMAPGGKLAGRFVLPPRILTWWPFWQLRVCSHRHVPNPARTFLGMGTLQRDALQDGRWRRWPGGAGEAESPRRGASPRGGWRPWAGRWFHPALGWARARSDCCGLEVRPVLVQPGDVGGGNSWPAGALVARRTDRGYGLGVSSRKASFGTLPCLAKVLKEALRRGLRATLSASRGLGWNGTLRCHAGGAGHGRRFGRWHARRSR